MSAAGLSLDRGTKGGKTFALRMIEWADPDSLEADGTQRKRQRLESTLTAAIRTLADDPEMTVGFGGREARVQATGCFLPPLPANPGAAEWAIARGQADGIALYLRHRDAAIEDRLRPHDPAAAEAFTLMQRCRCDALGVRRFRGVTANLDAALAASLTRHGVDGRTQANLLPVRLALTGMFRLVFGIPVTALGHDQISPWRAWLEGKAPDGVNRLARSLEDARAFSAAAAGLAPLVAGMLTDGLAARPTPVVQRRGDDEALRPAEAGVEVTGDTRTQAPVAAPFDAERKQEASPYRVYTERHDRIIDASELAPMAELERLYAQLQADMSIHRGTITRLANRLQRTILAQQRRSWDFDQEEGLLDTAKLDRVVVNPGTALSFKVDREGRFRDTAVALLIDNSGSMRGASIQMAAMAADVVTQALERCGVTVEVLGFTTRDWRGGPPAAEWARGGRPPDPGRLNALRHITYKRADKPGRRQRFLLAAMLQPSILKENIDGEALLWAWNRLAMRPEERKVLMVISDGAPNDAATLAANGPGYLDRHLRQVIAELERRPDLELCAIGIGHSVDHYYRRAITLKDAAGLGSAMVRQLASLFDDGAAVGS